MVNLDLPILNRVKNILTKTEKIDTDVTSVLTKLAEQGVDIDSIIASIGTSGDQASAATIFGKLAGLASQSGGIIKSIQKGNATYNYSDTKNPNSNTMNITISTITPSKSIVILQSRTLSQGDGERAFDVGGAVLKQLNANSIVIYPPYLRLWWQSGGSSQYSNQNGVLFSYTVIEFA